MPIKRASRIPRAFSVFAGGLFIGALATKQYCQFVHLKRDNNYFNPTCENYCDTEAYQRQAAHRSFPDSSLPLDLRTASVGSVEAQEQPSPPGSPPLTANKVPRDAKSRFLRYARRDEKTGEYVQYLDDFVACMLLMEPLPQSHTALGHPNRDDTGFKKKDNIMQATSRPVAFLHQFPPIVQTKMKDFFAAVDLDRNGKISYAEFVMLFTMLSTQRSTLHRAFRLFDLHNSGRLNASELVLLLNTLMVDPAVQVKDVGGGRDGKEVKKSLRSRVPSVASDRKGEQNSENDATQSSGQVESPTGRATIFPLWTSLGAIFSNRVSETGESLLVRSTESRHSKDLNLDLPFSSVEKFVFRALSPHGLVPPESVHRWSLSKQEKYLKDLEDLVQKDTEKRLLSFDSFWYRMELLKGELRAIEFGIFDPENTGFIHCEDFHKILTHQVSSAPKRSAQVTKTEKAKASGASPALSSCSGVGSGSAPANVSWPLYQTIFEIMQESDAVSHALQLTLDAEPPVLPSQLVAGAIPEFKREEAHAQINQLTGELYTANAKHARAALNKLVRPTGLTPPQLNQALHACDGIPKLTLKESEMLFHLFDMDHSGTITPDEFSRLCEAKQSFFAPYVLRFTEPKRNKIQQFFHCMQQLD